jgi:GH35 family endo-1,4-beta-xylanase
MRFVSRSFVVLIFAGCVSSPSSSVNDASQSETQDDVPSGTSDAAIGVVASPDVAMVTPSLTPPSACFPATVLPPILSVPAESTAGTTIPAGGTGLISAGIAIPSLYGGIIENVIDVTGQSFTKAFQYPNTTATGNAWDKGIFFITTGAVAAGDIVLVSFWARCAQSLAETAECATHSAFQLNTNPYTTEASLDITPGPIWTQYFMPFKAATSHPLASAEFTFSLNYANQTLELGGFSVLDYGTSLSLVQMPVTQITYDGRDANAPWRAVAAANIAKNRMANLTVHVVDAQGAPVSGAQVSVNMTRNAFGFGTAQAGHDFLPSTAIDGGVASPWNTYIGYLQQLFNISVEENALKWQFVAGDMGPSWNLALGIASIDWADQHGLRTRGHNLIWPSWRNSPVAVKALAAPDLRTTVNQHIQDEVTALTGKVDHWDVVNEPFDNHDITDLLGNCATPNCEAGLDEMATWFTQARAIDAKPKLFINDYAILEGGGGTTSHRDEYERIIQGLIARNAPLDGIGLQGHFGTALTSPDDLMTLLDRFGAYKELWVTEYDITITDLLLAGDYTRDFLTVLYSHPAVAGFLMWGFWDGAHWKKNAPLFTQDWKLKPAGVAYYDLVFNQWWTCTGGSTDDTGAYIANGHLGNYAISVTVGAQTVTSTASLIKGGADITVQLN